MAKKRMLADVLWDAANVHLAMGRRHSSSLSMRNGIFDVSCCAVLEALRPGWFARNEKFEAFASLEGLQFLQSLGCNPNTFFFEDEYMGAESRQGARYMWLLLAMHVAEDEGIEL